MKTLSKMIQVILVACGLYACGQKQTTQNEKPSQHTLDQREWSHTDSVVMQKLQGTWVFNQTQPCSKMGIKNGLPYEITMKLEVSGNNYTLLFGEQDEAPTKACEGQFKFFQYLELPAKTDEGWKNRMIAVEKCRLLRELALKYDIENECLKWYHVPQGDSGGDCVFKGCLEKVK